MRAHIIPAIKLSLYSFLLLGVIYPFIILAIAQISPNQGKGLLIESGGRTYYKNIGQNFTLDGYFWSRPSAVDYNAAGSGGSNLSSSNPEYIAGVKARIDNFLTKNPDVELGEVPSELVTASGSGLDPHLSVSSLVIQVPRISKVRGLAEKDIFELIDKTTEKPLWGLFGPEKINVLELNIRLDQFSKEKGVRYAK
ncbi:potassium-transporting ATPase subunit KdpC [Sphingobacterium endophyticum]|uniref:potassium-transporting ATPase subunit KdpC n=1 Tax=Sphingobacterium endophyticum TaxID=2546448 RepID=UPI0012E28229|nr:potassium-transporting ATPase subunit KdpC [Sphingobacterium endophyticum]